jgi:hypothetical protein
MVDDFSGQKKSQMKASTYAASKEYLSSFGAEPEVASSLDKAASTKPASGGLNQAKADALIANDPNFNKGIAGTTVVAPVQNNKTGTPLGKAVQERVNWYNNLPPAEQKSYNQDQAVKRAKLVAARENR